MIATKRRRSMKGRRPTRQTGSLGPDYPLLRVIDRACAEGERMTVTAEDGGRQFSILVDRDGPFNASGAGLQGVAALEAAAELSRGSFVIEPGWPADQPSYHLGLAATWANLLGRPSPTSALPPARGVDRLRDEAARAASGLPEAEHRDIPSIGAPMADWTEAATRPTRSARSLRDDFGLPAPAPRPLATGAPVLAPAPLYVLPLPPEMAPAPRPTSEPKAAAPAMSPAVPWLDDSGPAKPDLPAAERPELSVPVAVLEPTATPEPPSTAVAVLEPTATPEPPSTAVAVLEPPAAPEPTSTAVAVLEPPAATEPEPSVAEASAAPEPEPPVAEAPAQPEPDLSPGWQALIGGSAATATLWEPEAHVVSGDELPPVLAAADRALGTAFVSAANIERVLSAPRGVISAEDAWVDSLRPSDAPPADPLAPGARDSSLCQGWLRHNLTQALLWTIEVEGPERYTLTQAWTMATLGVRTWADEQVAILRGHLRHRLHRHVGQPLNAVSEDWRRAGHAAERIRRQDAARRLSVR